MVPLEARLVRCNAVSASISLCYEVWTGVCRYCLQLALFKDLFGDQFLNQMGRNALLCSVLGHMRAELHRIASGVALPLFSSSLVSSVAG